MDKETQEKLQELQFSEQNLQNILMQKQAFEIELNEVESAEEEVKNSNDEIFKITGQIMVKAKKEQLISDLNDKKRILNLRLKTLENQEKNIQEKVDKIKKEIDGKIN